MDTVGTFSMAKALATFGILTAVHKHYTAEEWLAFTRGRIRRRTQACDGFHRHVRCGFRKNPADPLSEPTAEFCVYRRRQRLLRALCTVRGEGARSPRPQKTIIAGNVVTGEMCEELILSGADIVKVGIGPGSVCTTRVKTGVGYPQLSAVIECADAAHGLGGQIISDGGCTMPGDVAKAFGGGADFVMLGGMLAGHEESGGTIVEENGEKFMLFYGMSSESAMTRHVGGVAKYRAAEGKTVKLPLRGPVENTARDILGGLRSACTYVGASRLKELTKRTTFIRVQEQENRVFNSL